MRSVLTRIANILSVSMGLSFLATTLGVLYLIPPSTGVFALLALLVTCLATFLFHLIVFAHPLPKCHGRLVRP